MKACFKCGNVLPLEEFYRHSRMADGHLNKCKECTKTDTESRRQIKLQDPQWVIAERIRGRKKTAKARLMGRAYQPSKLVRSQWNSRNRQKRRAQAIARKAVLRGQILPAECCALCRIKGIRLEKHHDDYSKPLQVTWLCTKCHGMTRRNYKVEIKTPTAHQSNLNLQHS